MASMFAESLRAYLKPVLAYLDDPEVSEIMINGPEDVWIEKKGKLYKTDARFSEEGLLGAARNMAQFVGRMLTDERPRLDARLPDGSRIHVVLPPIARRGTTLSIRKFFREKLTIDKLVDLGSMTEAMARFIEGCVRIKENILVSGGTGSGKTTLLNIVSSLIPDEERILTIEDSAELQLNQEHLVSFESRPADKLGKGEVNMGHLLHSALRLRPDRIVVGEVRGGEAFDLMQAMNTGHGGSMSTIHANTPTDTLRRLESLCLMSGVELPMVAVRAQVASAINVIVCCERFLDGSRRTTAISEVLPLSDKGDYRTQDLFVFTPTHKDADGRIHGYHAPTGIVPNFIDRLRAYGFSDLTEAFFDPETYGVPPPPLFHAEQGQTRWVGRLKHRERGEADGEEQERAWQEARLAKGKEAEAKETEAKAARASQGPKAADAPSPAPAVAEAARPAEARKPPPPSVSTRPPADRPKQLPPPVPRLANTAPAGSVEIDPGLLAEVHTENGPPPLPSDADDAEPSVTRSAPAHRPGPSAPRPPAAPIRSPGPRRPAPTPGLRGPAPSAQGNPSASAPPFDEEPDEGASDKTQIRSSDSLRRR